MAIRIRKKDGGYVALCAAKSEPKRGDLYLDDNIHHALTKKFENDFKSMGLITGHHGAYKTLICVSNILCVNCEGITKKIVENYNQKQ